ncbi:MAG: DUF192 domain-containing protein [Treponema sp.]|nr:DUF192 domain-containing protein [Treponema sp.]
MTKRFALLLFFSCLFLFSCNAKKLPKKDLLITRSDGSTINVNVEIASSPEERNFGFMERKNIPDGTGMIFVFDRDQILSFWMKNTPHPLSIAYIDSKGKIRNIFDMTPFSLSSIESTVSVRYALEVPQGWFSKNEITIGSTVDISGLN